MGVHRTYESVGLRSQIVWWSQEVEVELGRGRVESGEGAVGSRVDRVALGKRGVDGVEQEARVEQGEWDLGLDPMG